jgi:hypothetical protein
MDATTKTDPFATAIGQLAEGIQEVNTVHCVNVATIMIALVEKGILSDDDLKAARMIAISLTDQEQARHRDEYQREEMREALEALKRLYRRESP